MAMLHVVNISPNGTRRVASSHNLGRLAVSFDGATLVAMRGCSCRLRWPQHLSLCALIEEHVPISLDRSRLGHNRLSPNERGQYRQRNSTEVDIISGGSWS